MDEDNIIQKIYNKLQLTHIVLCCIILILIFINSIYILSAATSKSYDNLKNDIKKNISVSLLNDYKILCNYYIDNNFKYNDIILSINVYNDIFMSYFYFNLLYIPIVLLLYKLGEKNIKLFDNDYYDSIHIYKNFYYIILIVPIICFILYYSFYGVIINKKKNYDYRIDETNETIEQFIYNRYEKILSKTDITNNKECILLLNDILNNNNKYNFIKLLNKSSVETFENIQKFLYKIYDAKKINREYANINNDNYIFLFNVVHMCAILCKINENTTIDVVKTIRDFFKKCEYNYDTKEKYNNNKENTSSYGKKIYSDLNLTFNELIFKNIKSFVKIFLNIAKDENDDDVIKFDNRQVIFLHSLLTEYYLNIKNTTIDGVDIPNNDVRCEFSNRILGMDNYPEKKNFNKNIKFFKDLTLSFTSVFLVLTSITLIIFCVIYKDAIKNILIDKTNYIYLFNNYFIYLIKNSHKNPSFYNNMIIILDFINKYINIMIPLFSIIIIILFIVFIKNL